MSKLLMHQDFVYIVYRIDTGIISTLSHGMYTHRRCAHELCADGHLYGRWNWEESQNRKYLRASEAKEEFWRPKEV